ncbi:hypothetical protein B0I35DRAFT_435661 [Stachybotrys elegans]|uniref:Zn(2)-C6 fungal-type domain-containing protein n=1 Tax=Stachybotrys elegans TaxID=80388 RepID=A0A8K0WR17_9HYPO|nr:hypothetical protein B0I35DRAFT_435661 [Stachybotrys elegans]
MDTPPAGSPASHTYYIRSRIANACDTCKARKVKCDGRVPCTYCARRQQAQSCHYSPQRRRRPAAAAAAHVHRHTAPPSPLVSSPRRVEIGDERREEDRAEPASKGQDGMTAAAAAATEEETEVPREARLLCDTQGKLVFIGDCAPLSFFQSVRQLVTTRVAHNAFAPQTSRYSVLENAAVRPPGLLYSGAPPVRAVHVAAAVEAYLAATVGLVDLFDHDKLHDDMLLWANLDHRPEDITSIVKYLVLAIGRQMSDPDAAQVYFEYARDRAYGDLSGNLGVGTVQAFILVTMYMLCSCQINGAFLFFGVAVRAAYSIGVHRTEVNARFGAQLHRERDRLWKSLRIVDLFLSTSMGRPPAASDVDCTVPYRNAGEDGSEPFDLLNASVQILMITEVIVVQIYSRKKISLQLTEGISVQLRDWSLRWLRPLKEVIAGPGGPEVSGACQVLSTYYYAVMLVSRPFLMYELCRRLSDGPSGRAGLASGKSKLADACIDAASLMVDPILDLIERGALNGKVPLLVSWLFASSLVLGVGLLGGFGRILEKYTRRSIQALDHFARHDNHAVQYSLIAQSLLTTALDYLEKRELQERLRRTENSSQLFGLVPHDMRHPNDTPTRHRDDTSVSGGSPARTRESLDRSFLQHQGLLQGASPPRIGDIDGSFLGLGESLLQTPDETFWARNMGSEVDPSSALNLFPLLDAGGGIDLAHYL